MNERTINSPGWPIAQKATRKQTLTCDLFAPWDTMAPSAGWRTRLEIARAKMGRAFESTLLIDPIGLTARWLETPCSRCSRTSPSFSYTLANYHSPQSFPSLSFSMNAALQSSSSLNMRIRTKSILFFFFKRSSRSRARIVIELDRDAFEQFSSLIKYFRGVTYMFKVSSKYISNIVDHFRSNLSLLRHFKIRSSTFL